MWTDVTNEGPTIRWVVKAIRNGTAIWATDGSFKKEVALFISGAGWIIYCTMCKRKLCGSFFEHSHQYGSYRGELLGLLAIHTLLSALEAYYSLPASKGKICCDNQGALFKSKEY